MGRKKRRRAIEAVKSLLIVVLTLSAIYLALCAQIYGEGRSGQESGWLGAVLEFFDHTGGSPAPGGGPDHRRPEIRPMQVAVNIRDVGRYGVQYDQERTDEVFTRIFSTLLEALDGAQTPRAVSEREWRRVLSEQSGIYLDFQGTIPLSLLSAMGDGNSGVLGDVPVRRLLLAEENSGTAILYYKNEEDGLFYACGTTQALQGHVQELVSGYGVNGAVFAYEEEKWTGLAPYVLLNASSSGLSGQSRHKVYLASNPVSTMDAGREELLEALGFHTQQNNSYRRGNYLVVNEWPDTLVIADSGTVSYETAGGEMPKYPVAMAGEAPTVLEMIEAAQALVERTVGAETWRGEGRVYLMGLREVESGTWQVDYGYSLNGVCVERTPESFAARFTIRDGQISAFTLHLRSYTDSGEQSIVLPDVQAAAALGALEAEGTELTLAYEDRGGERLEARWIARKP